MRFRIAGIAVSIFALGMTAVPVQAAQDDAVIATSARAIGDTKLRAAMLNSDRGEVLSLIVPEGVIGQLTSVGFEVGDRVGSLPYFTARATREEMVQATKEGLGTGVSLNRLVPGVRPADVPDWMRPVLMNTSELTGATRLHAKGTSGVGTSIAIIDSGIQASHPYFRDASGRSRVVAESCFVSLQFNPNPDLPCPGGQGSAIGPGAADIGSDVRFGHGTHVAGVAAGNAAQAPGASGYTGMAPEANLVVSRVFGSWGATDADIAAALDWVASVAPTHNIAAVNLSLGFFQSRYFDCQALADSIYATVTAKVRAAGVAIVAAAGNEGSLTGIGVPACGNGWVSVGATDLLTRVAAFSNISADVDLLAPGVAIWSSLPFDSFDALSGTSMAAPAVAGAFALIRQAAPSASSDAALEAMRASGPRINDVIVKDLPILRVDAALSQLTGDPEAAPTVPEPPVNVSIQPMNGAVRVSWSAPPRDGGSPITGYVVEARPGGAFCLPTGDTSCIIGGLSNGTAYATNVYARNAFGASSPARSGEVRPTNDVPDPPRPRPAAVKDLGVQSLKGAIKVSWRAPYLAAGQGPVSYEYRVGRSIPKPTQMLSVRVEGKTGIPIKVTVRALNKTGPGPWVSITGTPR